MGFSQLALVISMLTNLFLFSLDLSVTAIALSTKGTGIFVVHKRQHIFIWNSFEILIPEKDLEYKENINMLYAILY